MKGMNEAEKGNGLGLFWCGVLQDISAEEMKKPCNYVGKIFAQKQDVTAIQKHMSTHFDSNVFLSKIGNLMLESTRDLLPLVSCCCLM